MTVFHDQSGEVVQLIDEPLQPVRHQPVAKLEDNFGQETGSIFYPSFDAELNSSSSWLDCIAIGRRNPENDAPGWKAIHEDGESGKLVTNFPTASGQVRPIGTLIGIEPMVKTEGGRDEFSLAIRIDRTLAHLSLTEYCQNERVSLITRDQNQPVD